MDSDGMSLLRRGTLAVQTRHARHPRKSWHVRCSIQHDRSPTQIKRKEQKNLMTYIVSMHLAFEGNCTSGCVENSCRATTASEAW